MDFEDFFDAPIASPRHTGRERIIEILVFLLGEARKHRSLADIDLKPLASLGFTTSEISTAFSWLFDKMAIAAIGAGMRIEPFAPAERLELVPTESTSFRIYHEMERGVLSMEAQGYLLQLRELGLMSDTDLELLIDRILASGIPTIGVREIKELVGNLIFEFDDSTRMGSRLMLGVGDTVQ